MTVINVKEVQKKIAFHESQISALRKLLDLAGSLEGVKAAPAGKRGAAVKARKKPGRRKRRGAVSSAVMALLGEAGKALPAGEIKKTLEAKGLAKKGSASIYSTLLQMSKRGLIKKVKTAEGNCYQAAPQKGAAKSGKK